MTRKRIVASLLLGACLAVGVYTLNFARASSQTPVSSQTKQTVPFTQEITSCVKGVRVVKADVRYPETPDAAVEVEIENVSNLGIVAVSMESIKCPESYTTTLRSSFTSKEPIVVIAPHKTATLTTSRSSVFPDVPLRLGSVIYADGTEEGCEDSLKTLHQVKEHEQPNS